MGRGYRSKLFAEPNTWHADENGCVWEYGSYRYCYLVIRLDGNGKYIPSVGSFTGIGYNDKKTPASGRFEYDTLEQAKQHLYDYVDFIRDVQDARDKRTLHNSLHDRNPAVYA